MRTATALRQRLTSMLRCATCGNAWPLQGGMDARDPESNVIAAAEALCRGLFWPLRFDRSSRAKRHAMHCKFWIDDRRAGAGLRNFDQQLRSFWDAGRGATEQDVAVY